MKISLFLGGGFPWLRIEDFTLYFLNIGQRHSFLIKNGLYKSILTLIWDLHSFINLFSPPLCTLSRSLSLSHTHAATLMLANTAQLEFQNKNEFSPTAEWNISHGKTVLHQQPDVRWQLASANVLSNWWRPSSTWCLTHFSVITGKLKENPG